MSGNICYFTRRCIAEIRHKSNACKIRKKEEELKKNEYKVRFEKRKMLYVEFKNMVIEVPNPYDYIPSKVSLELGDNGMYYVDGYAPKKEIKKENFTKKAMPLK